MNVKELMTESVVTAGPHDTLEDAARLMWDHDIGALPVVDRDQRAIGMITDRDICMAAYTQGKTLRDIHVDDVMSRLLLTCSADEPLAVAEETMQRGQVRRLPVTDVRGHLVGVVSLNDLARASHHRGRTAVKAEEVVVTLAAVAEPRQHETARPTA